MLSEEDGTAFSLVSRKNVRNWSRSILMGLAIPPNPSNVATKLASMTSTTCFPSLRRCPTSFTPPVKHSLAFGILLIQEGLRKDWAESTKKSTPSCSRKLGRLMLTVGPADEFAQTRLRWQPTKGIGYRFREQRVAGKSRATACHDLSRPQSRTTTAIHTSFDRKPIAICVARALWRTAGPLLCDCP